MPLLDVRHLTKHFVRRHGLFRAPSLIKAVDDVSFAIEEGEMFGLVGESGSGKSTDRTLHPPARRTDIRRSVLSR